MSFQRVLIICDKTCIFTCTYGTSSERTYGVSIQKDTWSYIIKEGTPKLVYNFPKAMNK